MDYNMIKDPEVRRIIEEFTRIVGVSYSSQMNANHFGTIDWAMALEFMKLAELRKLNESLEDINYTLSWIDLKV